MLKFAGNDGSEFIFREPRMKDAKACLDYVNELVEEGAPININKKVTLREERAWLRGRSTRSKGTKHHARSREKRGNCIGL
jgi:hypothetical protein